MPFAGLHDELKDGGTIVERGTHDELIAGQGRYYEIIRRELLSSELEALE